MTNKEPNLKLNSVLISATLITVISVFPVLNLLNLFLCAGVIIGSFTGVSYYIKNSRQRNLSLEFKDGAIIGVLGGVLSAILVSIITLVITLLAKENPMAQVKEMMGSIFSMETPEINNMMNKLSDEFDTYGFSPTISIITLITYLITYSLFGFLGGIFAYSVKIRNKNTKFNP